jgi:hypothetical protein
VGLTRQTAGDGKAEHGDDGGSRSLLGAMAEVGDPGGDGIWGSGEETDIWSKGGRWIIGLVFWWLVRGRFLGAQCP